MRNSKTIAFTTSLIILASVLGGGVAHATKSFISDSKVFQVRAYQDGFGGCVAVVSNVNTSGTQTLTCPESALVTFDCSGEQGAGFASAGRTLFSQAQLAYVTGENVSLFVDDSVQINGVCYSELIFVK